MTRKYNSLYREKEGREKDEKGKKGALMLNTDDKLEKETRLDPKSAILERGTESAAKKAQKGK